MGFQIKKEDRVWDYLIRKSVTSAERKLVYWEIENWMTEICVRIVRKNYHHGLRSGGTLYDIEKTLADIKSRTSHLSNLKIGVMGCIVNGPGEMADADYGYVGAVPGRITLYKGRTVVARNIPQEEALDRLVELIKADGEWVEP